MMLKDILDGLQRGPGYREYVAERCDITALSRFKILEPPLPGLYGELKDEAIAIRISLKADPSQWSDAFVGSDAGPDLLRRAGQNVPPCFNPLRANSTGRGHSAQDVGERHNRQAHTAFNQELLDIINLFFIVLHMDLERRGTAIANCLHELSGYPAEDLPAFWAKSMNSIMRRYDSSLADINARLHALDGNARVFSFPQVRQRLERRNDLSPGDILF